MPQRVNHLLTALVKHQREGRGGGPGRRETIMEWTKIEHFAKIRPAEMATADLQVARCLAAAAAGDVDAYNDLGVIYSTGGHGVAPDLVEAHKWFNLAAANGHEEAARCRADECRAGRGEEGRNAEGPQDLSIPRPFVSGRGDRI